MKKTALGIATGFVAAIGLAQLSRAQGAYTLVDRVEDSWVNRNPVPYRPMVANPDGSLWAVNPYLSEVVRIVKDAEDFEFSIAASNARFRTLPGPVSIARHQPDTGNAQLLVVCQHVNAVAIHDATNGDLLASVKVPAGPADVLVDEDNDRAWVSCFQADQVVTIDLGPRTIGAVFDTAALSRHPGFLSMLDGEVLVAPRISGNGSLVDRKDFTRGGPAAVNGAQDFDEHSGERGILDTLKTEIAETGLPDNDLIWLDLGGTTPEARSVATSTGTLLFAHAVRPGTTTLWQLNVDSNNKDPLRQSEPSILGEIVFNRVTMISLPDLIGDPDSVTSVYLDSTILADEVGEIVYAPVDEAMATPYSLAFDSTGSMCAVAGLMSDDVILLDGTGTRIANGVIDLDESPTDEVTMPRQVLSLGDGVFAVWGGNLTAHFFDASVLPPVDTDWLDLGFDPTPGKIQKGRKLFFDGSNSLHGNASCASCHDEGKTDMLAWNLSDVGDDDDVSEADGFDNKGPMVTQTLVGIAEAVPFHWRGEQLRGLVDFNPAFEKLLGGERLAGVTESGGTVTIAAGSDFDVFQAFVLSLTEDANQFQHRDRVIDPALEIPEDSRDGTLATGRPDNPSGIDAVNGQTRFAAICGGCHNFPNGTNNEVVDNAFGGEANPDRLWLKVAPFQGMQFKAKQHLTDVTFADGTGFPDDQTYPILGQGVSHAGTVRDIIPFMDILLDASDADQFADQRDIASFIFQWDTGTAPACHEFVLMNEDNAEDLIDDLDSDLYWLIEQAATGVRNCDIAVVGRLTSGTADAPAHGWVFDRIPPAGVPTPYPPTFFGPDASGLNDAGRDLAFFEQAALAGGRFAFIGVPVGSAWKFAVDFDGDQLPNHLETQHGYDMFVADTDSNTIWDGAQFYGSGGEPAINNDPSDNSPDVIPATPLPNFQWVTQKVARLTFETDELTVAELTMTPNLGLPVITVKETMPKMQHNLLVTSLVYPATYTVVLKITDRGGWSPPNLLVPKQTTTLTLPSLNMATRVPTPITGTNGLVTIGALSLAPGFPARQGATQIWDFEYNVTAFNRISQPRANIWVAARALINGIPATDTQFIPATEQTWNGVPFTTFDVDGIHYTPTEFIHNEIDEVAVPQNAGYPAVLVPGAIPGPYAIGFNLDTGGGILPTNASGTCRLKFTLDFTGDPPEHDDVVTLSIEAMGVSLTPEDGHDRINMQGAGSFGRFTDQHDGTAATGGTFNGGGGQFPSLFGFPRTPADRRRIDLEFDGATQTWGL